MLQHSGPAHDILYLSGEPIREKFRHRTTAYSARSLTCGVHAAGRHCGHRLSGRDLRHPVHGLGTRQSLLLFLRFDTVLGLTRVPHSASVMS